MKCTLRILFIIASFGISAVAATADEGDTAMSASSDRPQTKHYLVRLLGTRPTWPDDQTPAEEQTMSAHFEYLRDLTAKGKVLMAGPCFDAKFGLVVLNVESEAEARQIMDNEPSVTGGLHTYELGEMLVSLMANYIPPDRYPSEISAKSLNKDVTIPAPVSDVWRAWTTTEGLKSFFSPNAHVELRPGGPFEIYFLMDQPYGLRGSEGCKILSFIPEKMLSFEWNAPPSFADIRWQHTQVIIFFHPVSANETRIEFIQRGWGVGESWDNLYDYFDRAWGYVLGNLKERFEKGPLDWSGE